MTEHQITFNCYQPAADRRFLEVTCSCGEHVWTGPFPVAYSELAPVLTEHLKEQAKEVFREILKEISFKDIIGFLRHLKKDQQP
jgi:hypothetical protein